MSIEKIVDQLESLVDEVSDLKSNLTIDFSIDAYNLIASLYEEQNRMADALERIATALEKK